MRLRSLSAVWAVLAVTASTFAAPSANAQQQVDNLQWGPCPVASGVAPDAVCAEFQVPLDYSQPDGPQITLTMSKIPAVGASRGVIAGNPGGPGGDALGMFSSNLPGSANDARVKFPEDIRSQYDQIAVEPRGLAYGEALNCQVGPVNAATMSLFGAGVLREYCNLVQPGLMDRVTTENTARDLNEARQLLGVERLNLYGLSYGGVLMSTYATLFPQHTNKVVLDSSASQEMQWLDLGAERTQGRHDSLQAMFQWIADRNDVYGLGTTPLQVYQRWSARVNEETGVPAQVTSPPAQLGDLPAGLRQNSDVVLPAVNQALPPFWRLYSAWATLAAVKPLATSSSPLYQYTFFVGLYDENSWDSVARYIRDGQIPEAQAQLPTDAEALQEVINQQVTFGTVERAIICNENRNALRPELSLPVLVDGLTGGDVITWTGNYLSSGLYCAGWPEPTPAPTISGDALDTKPLLLGYSHDSAVTPAAITQMQAVMGGEMIVIEGHSHGVLIHDPDKVAPQVRSYMNQ